MEQMQVHVSDHAMHAASYKTIHHEDSQQQEVAAVAQTADYVRLCSRGRPALGNKHEKICGADAGTKVRPRYAAS